MQGRKVEPRLIRDRYQLIQQLSHKAGRQTWLAMDQQQGRKVVLKMLSFDGSLEWDSLKLFEREAKVLQTLEHAQIPEFLDFFELDEADGNEFVLVQSHIEALSLTEHLQAGRTFSELEIRQLAKSLLEILQYLHSRNPAVIHRDIKPSNVLLSDRSGNYVGQVYLVDFGSVQAAGVNSSATFTVVGTYGYMAPEQFLGRATSVSDLYGLGTTLIYLATGRHPVDLMDDDLKVNWQQSATLSSALKNWIQRLIEPTPSLRFSDVEEALKALQNPLVSTETSAVGSTASQSVNAAEQMLARYPLPPWSGLPWKRRLKILGLAKATQLLFIPIFFGYILISIFGGFTGNNRILFGYAIYGSYILIHFLILPIVLYCFLPDFIGFAFLWRIWGDELKEAGDYQEALVKYNRAISIRPKSCLAWEARGDALSRLERQEEALTSYEKVIGFNPNSSPPWTDRGRTLHELGRYEEALASYDRAIELKPRYQIAWRLRGHTLNSLGRYDEAAASYERALVLRGENA